jgi:DNA polymerase-3 subunit epsilon
VILLGVDTETTGIDPAVDRIIEIGAILYDTEAKVPLHMFNTLIRLPTEDGYVSPTGIRGEWLRQFGMSLQDAFGEIQRFASMAEVAAACGHNAENFDKPIILAELERLGFQEHCFKELHWIDSRYDLPFEVPPTSRRLVHLAAEKGIVNPFPHRALFDVLTMLKLMDHYDYEAVLRHSKVPWVKARICTNYDQRQIAKDLRYSWDDKDKIWTKKVKEDQFDAEVKAAKERGVDVVKVRS